MEQMGMTDAQWKDNLRNQLENWEDVRDLLSQLESNPIVKQILKLVDRNITRIKKGLED